MSLTRVGLLDLGAVGLTTHRELSPSAASRILDMGLAPIRIVVFRVAATARSVAKAQRNDVLAEKGRSASNAPLPADFPNHTRRIVVSIKHGFAPHSAVIRPAFGDNEPIGVTASVLCARYSGGFGFGVLPRLLRLSRCAAAAGVFSRQFASHAGTGSVTARIPKPYHAAKHPRRLRYASAGCNSG